MSVSFRISLQLLAAKLLLFFDMCKDLDDKSLLRWWLWERLQQTDCFKHLPVGSGFLVYG